MLKKLWYCLTGQCEHDYKTYRHVYNTEFHLDLMFCTKCGKIISKRCGDVK